MVNPVQNYNGGQLTFEFMSPIVQESGFMSSTHYLRRPGCGTQSNSGDLFVVPFVINFFLLKDTLLGYLFQQQCSPLNGY